MTTRTRLCTCSALLFSALTAADAGPGYHVLKTYVIGGTDGWDYVALDSIYQPCSRANATDRSGSGLRQSPRRGHRPQRSPWNGVRVRRRSRLRDVRTGQHGDDVQFETYQVLGKLRADEDADAVLYDRATNRVYTMNGDANTSTVIDPAAGKVVGTIRLGGKPEFAVSAGNGMLYANLEDKASIAEIDAKALKVVREWPLAPCASPTGLALDGQHHRLFSGCRNRIMAVSDVRQGRLLATVPIGAGVDGNAYDSGTGFAFSSRGWHADRGKGSGARQVQCCRNGSYNGRCPDDGVGPHDAQAVLGRRAVWPHARFRYLRERPPSATGPAQLLCAARGGTVAAAYLPSYREVVNAALPSW